MKIESSLAPASTPGVDTQKRTTKPQTKTEASSGDVQLSFAGRLQSLEEQGNAPVDNAKVAAIKQAIAEGRFSINADAIADRLINSAQELLRKQDQS